MSDLRRRYQGEALLGLVIDALPEAVFVIDSEARIVAANRAGALGAALSARR